MRSLRCRYCPLSPPLICYSNVVYRVDDTPSFPSATRLPGRRWPQNRQIKASSRKTPAPKIVYPVDENAKKSVYRKKSGTQDKEGVMWAFSGKTEPFSGKTWPA